jgi:hypothetical protein
VVISYKYKGKYTTKKCSCFKNSVKCSVHCYYNSKYNCGFLASLVLYTEVGLKDKESKEQGGKRGRV